MKLRVIPEGAVSPLQILSVVLIIALVVGIYYVNNQVSVTGSVISQSRDQLASCNSELSDCKGNLAGSQTNLEVKTGELGTCNTELSTCKSSLGVTAGSEAACRTDLNNCVIDMNSAQQNYNLCNNELGECNAENSQLTDNYYSLADNFARLKCCGQQGFPETDFYTISGSNIICTNNEGQGTRPTNC